MRVHRAGLAPERVEHHAPRDLSANAGQAGEVLLDLLVLQRSEASEVELALAVLDFLEDGLDLTRLRGGKAGVGEEILKLIRRSVSHASPIWH